MAITLALAGGWLLSPSSRPGQALVRSSYDLSFSLPFVGEPSLSNSPVIVVYLDVASYQREQQDATRPWDRRLHARLVQRLTSAGARAVVFDIVFAEPAPDPAADRIFAEAIQSSGRVILAAEWNRSSRNVGEDVATRTLSLPVEPLRSAAAAWGYAFTAIDDDFEARRYTPGFPARDLPSLTWAAAKFLRLPALNELEQIQNGTWNNYYGRPFAIPHVSYSAALDSRETPDEFFRGKVVLVGARPSIGTFNERRDELRNPFSARVGGELFMPGVEVHATQMLNLMRREWLLRLPGSVQIAVVFAAATLLSLLVVVSRPLAALGLAAMAETVLIASAGLAFARYRLWFPWLIVAVVQIPAALTWSWFLRSLEWYRQKRRYQAKIREQAALIDKANDAIVLTDLNRRITYLNPSAERLYGKERATKGSMWAGGSSRELETAWKQVLSTGEWAGELRQDRADGRTIEVASRWTLIRDDHGNPSGVLCLNTDITEQKRLQEQVFRSQRMETVGAVASGMAHDLNSALAPVLLGVQTLRRKLDDGPTLQLLDAMESGTRRAAGMVQQVVGFSRGQQTEARPLDFRQLLTELENMLRSTFPTGITISSICAADLWPAIGNATQIHQVLLNLCVNARDAMPAGGELTLAADNVDLDASSARDLRDGRPGRYVLLLVSDTGTGMAPEIQERIFEPFFTTKLPNQGTGLGLPTVRLIVQQHQGFIDVKSGVGEGTTFEIYLPAIAQNPPLSSTEVRPDRQATGKTILIVSDEHAIGTLFASELRKEGCQPLVMTSITAVQHLNSCPLPPDLVILPQGRIARIEEVLLTANNGALKNVPVLLVHPVGERAEPGGASALPCVTVMEPPFRMEEIWERVRGMLLR